MIASRRPLISLAVLCFVAGAANTRGAEALERSIYPLAKIDSMRTPKFELDLSETGDDAKLATWGRLSQELSEAWFPIVCRMLATDRWTPPATIRLVMRRDMDAPASASGGEINLNTRWIAEHPDDFGMVIHELTHVIQNYPGGQPGWLVEGIADYIRYWKYEPEKPRGRVSATASYRDGYSTTGAFLAWVVWKYDRSIVRRLDERLRTNANAIAVFQEQTGKSVDALWTEYVQSQRH